MDEIARRIAESIADRYHIERKLGAGGMADVFLARDLRHDREIATKCRTSLRGRCEIV